MYKSLRRACGWFLALAVVCTALPPVQATEYADVTGHWARAAIERWSDLGILKGNNGLFRPDDPVTRCELAAILNRMLKYPDWPINTFDDLPATHWAYRDLLALARQNVLHLEDESLVRPEEPLSRQEAVFMIYSAFRPPSNRLKPLTFKDTDQIAQWANMAIRCMKNYGFINGTPDGYFMPERLITRAEVVTILDNMIDTMVTESGVYSEPLGKNVLISAPDVTLLEAVGKQLEMLFISPGVEHGTVTVDITGDKGLPNEQESWYTSMMCYDPEQYIVTNPMEEYRHTVYRRYSILAPVGDARFEGGYGVESAPYLISTQEQLELIREWTSYEYRTISQLPVYYKLINDITLEGFWTPLGFNDDYFRGHLDGNGYTIRGMQVEVEKLGLLGRAGFFCMVSGSVKNLTLEGSVTVTTPLDMSYPSYDIFYVGGLAGRLRSENIYNFDRELVSRSAAVLENCVSNVTVTVLHHGTANEIAVGGLVGMADADTRIVNCTAAGDVTARQSTTFDEKNPPGTRAGGLIGASYGSVTDSHASGNVLAVGGEHTLVGGLIGNVLSGEISRCYATGNVQAEGASFQNNAGGFSGQVHYAAIDSSWACGDVIVGTKDGADAAIHVAGGFVSGIYNGSVIQNCFATGAVTDYGIWFLPMTGSFTGRTEGTLVNCYATGSNTIIDEYGATHAYNTIVGSRRGAGGSITHCADLTDNETGKPFFLDEPAGGKAVQEARTPTQMTQQATYTSHGWDFESIWKMPGGSGYPLPILRGVGEDLQTALPMPKHLK